MLDSQDPEVVFDLRVNNSGRPEMYAEFWKCVGSLFMNMLLKQWMTAAMVAFVIWLWPFL